MRHHVYGCLILEISMIGTCANAWGVKNRIAAQTAAETIAGKKTRVPKKGERPLSPDVAGPVEEDPFSIKASEGVDEETRKKRISIFGSGGESE